MKYLRIDVDLESSDLQEWEIKEFLKESKKATGINIEVGRGIKDSSVCRVATLSSDYFTAFEVDDEDQKIRPAKVPGRRRTSKA